LDLALDMFDSVKGLNLKGEGLLAFDEDLHDEIVIGLPGKQEKKEGKIKVN